MQGLLLLNKPENITSYGAVARIKRLSGEKRVGHTGTLDPMATGVLPVLLGRATALSSCLLDADKSYEARLRLGTVTDTCDITGNVVETHSVTVSDDQVLEVLGDFCGEQDQVPPMYSALKKDGVRLYELARKGIEVEIPKRRITVYSIDRISKLDENAEFSINVRVSKGTYIRSLCRDIGNALGCGATLTALARTETSGFSLKDCVPLGELSEENIGEYVLSAETAVAHLKKINVTQKQAIRFCNGGQLAFDRVNIKDPKKDELYRIGFGDRFLGLGIADTENSQISIKCIVDHL